jgi:hypothetical protein
MTANNTREGRGCKDGMKGEDGNQKISSPEGKVVTTLMRNSLEI